MSDPEEFDFSESDEEESDDESSDAEEEDLPVKEARKDAVYNTVGLHDKLEEIGWPESADWTHSVSLTFPDSGQTVDVDDDLSREMSFYTQALEGAKEAYQKFQALGIPFLRPSDYYAEMVKTDTHMLKIKESLLQEKTQVEEMEERRKAREAKKFSKEVQAEKLKERQKRKKDDIESVKKWRKVRQKSGFTEGGDEGPPINFDTGKSNGQRFGKSSGGSDRQTLKSRQFRDSKYGNGGRKSDKRNNAESSADDSTFRASFKGQDRGRGSKGRGRGRGGGGGRFGESSRGRSGSRGRGSGSRGGRGRGRGRN